MIVVEGIQRSIRARLKKIQRRNWNCSGSWQLVVVRCTYWSKNKYTSFDRKWIEKWISGNDFLKLAKTRENGAF